MNWPRQNVAGKCTAMVVGLFLWPAAASAGSPWATTVYNYSPGLLITSNDSIYDSPDAALGPIDPSASDTNGASDVVQLGQRAPNPGFSYDLGSLTLGFDHSILNNASDSSNAINPSGFDFTVFGNAFTIMGAQLYFREPGFVEVAQKQSNGTPGTFYLLLPEKLPKDMIAWDPRAASPDTGPGTQLLAGYADEHPVDGSGDPTRAPDVAGSAGGDGFKLEWAVEESSAGIPQLDVNGKPIFVSLNEIDFVRITDVLAGDNYITGGITTDIDAVIDLSGTATPEPTTLLFLLPVGVLLRRKALP